MAGEVEAVGNNVTQFKPGEAGFGWMPGRSGQGSLAEYASTPESSLVRKPENASFEQAGSVAVAGITALQGLRDKGTVRRGQKV